MESKAPMRNIYELQTGSNTGGVLYSYDSQLLKYLCLVLQSGFIKNETVPLSTVFISQAGIGKSRLLELLKKEKYVYYVTDITPKPFIKEFLEALKSGKYKFICIPDFTNITDSHSERTGSTVISLLRNVTAEGIENIKDYGMEFISDINVYAGLITGTTISSYGEFNYTWKKTGFLSRLMPFSFTHSPNVKQSVLDNINNDESEKILKLPYKINEKPKKIKANKELLEQLSGYAEVLGITNNSMPYRAMIQYRRLVKSNAILRGDNKMIQEDINDIRVLTRYLNYKFEAI